MLDYRGVADGMLYQVRFISSNIKFILMWAIKIGISTPFKDRYCTNRPELDLHDWWGYDISIAHILYW